MFNKVKILVVGPKQSGKTVLSNFLSDASEWAGSTYHPTQGVRILEFEVEGVDIGGGHRVNLEVELWDCSGDQSFDMCWPAIQKDANGVLFLYNAGVGAHEKELENWHLHFVKQRSVKEKQCFIFAHSKPGLVAPTKLQKLGGGLGKIRVATSNLEEDPDAVRENFNRFLGDVLILMNDNREQEELSIIE